MNIKLKGLSGLEVGEFIRNDLGDRNTSIVFISQGSQYAMQLFRLQSVDFLLKPLDYEKIDDVLTFWNRLNRSAEKCLEVRSGKRFFRIPMTIFYICIAITRLSMWLWRTERNAFMKR